MKKSSAYLFCVCLILLLAGCSFGNGVASISGPGQKYVFSKSIWVSHDGGKNWEVSNISKNKPRISDINPLSLAFDAKNPDISYIGLRSGGIIKTTDGGASWEFMNLNTDNVYGLDVDPVDSKIIYATTTVNSRGKIFKSIDSGANWKEIYTFAANGPLATYLKIDKHNPKVIYVSTSDDQLIKSIDSGSTWKNIFQTSSMVLKISIDAENDNNIYLITKNGDVFFSSNAGNSFDNLSNKNGSDSIFNSGFSSMRTAPVNAGGVYFWGKSGIIHSNDEGKTWKKIVTLNNPQNSPVSALTINPRNSNEIMYGALQATYKSNDGGNTWATSQFDLAKTINILEYNPVNSDVVFACFSSK
jgi:photosystem II stability/assembly factor-like uncharacterized protein